MRLVIVSFLFCGVLVGGWALGRATLKREPAGLVREEVQVGLVFALSAGLGTRLDGFLELDERDRLELILSWSGERPELVNLALAHWATLDPLAALSAVDSLPKSMWPRSRGAVLGEWMRVDSVGAMAFLEGLDDVSLRGNGWWDAFQSAGEQLATLNPMAAVRLVMIPIDANRGKPWGILDVVYEEWALNDRESLFEWAREIGEFAPRSMAIGALGSAMGRVGREGLTWLDGLDLSKFDRGVVEGRFALSWVAMDADDVERGLLAGDFENRSGFESELIAELLALRADGMRSEDVWELFGKCEKELLPILENQVSRDELAELVSVVDYSESWESLDLAWDLGEELAAEDPAAAVEWLRGMRSDELRFGVGPPMMKVLEADLGAEKAFAFLTTFDGDEHVAWVSDVFASLSVGAPEDWVARLEQVPATAREASRFEMARLWVERDPGAVGEWADRMEPGKSRDTVVRVLVDAFSDKDPGTAKRWAASLSEP